MLWFEERDREVDLGKGGYERTVNVAHALFDGRSVFNLLAKKLVTACLTGSLR
jgi:hypothetical protein